LARVVDYAWARPSISAIRALGTASDPVIGVVRYLSYDSSKNLSAAEYATLKRAGLAVALVWETTAGRSKGGYSAGRSDATVANRLADALSYPGAIYYAVDFDPSSADMAKVLDYFKGVNSVAGNPVGVYGGYDTIEACRYSAKYFWQTSAWSGGKVSSRADLYQHIYNSDTDVSAVKASDWGQDKKSTYPAFPLPAGQEFGNEVMSGHGLDVWQARMDQRGWTITADGVYGPETKKVATAFQQEKNLTVDGLIGPQTWNAAWTIPVT